MRVLEAAASLSQMPLQDLAKNSQLLIKSSDAFKSIDEALHYVSEINGLTVLGKCAIAHCILEAESNSIICNSHGQDDFKFTTSDNKNWLLPLLVNSVAALKKSEIPTAFNNITFLSFNYDRVIERYLFLFLTRSCLLNADEAREIVNSLNIIRPYGSVGSLYGASRRDYGAELISANDIIIAASSIRTYTEQLVDNIIEENIKLAVDSADTILLLGFGFHSQNMSLFEDIGRVGNNPYIFSTAYAIDDFNNKYIVDNLSITFSTSEDKIFVFNLKAHDMTSKISTTLGFVC